MLKFIFGSILPLLLIILIFVNIVLPALYPKLSFFWMFKKSTPDEQPPSTLNDLNKEVDTTMKQYKSTKKKVDNTAKQVDEIKSKTNIQ